ncbi:MAG: hypothetical protein ACKOFU_04600, partial [Actinomycetota bacterium]
MRSRSLLALVISSALLLTLAPGSVAINDEPTDVFLFPSYESGSESVNKMGIVYDDNQTLLGTVSNLVDQTKKSPPDNAPYCSSVNDPKCKDVETLWADQIMGPCESASD